MTTYTTYSAQRGHNGQLCGHGHRTVSAAAACTTPGQSERLVVANDPGAAGYRKLNAMEVITLTVSEASFVFPATMEQCDRDGYENGANMGDWFGPDGAYLGVDNQGVGVEATR